MSCSFWFCRWKNDGWELWNSLYLCDKENTVEIASADRNRSLYVIRALVRSLFYIEFYLGFWSQIICMRDTTVFWSCMPNHREQKLVRKPLIAMTTQFFDYVVRFFQKSCSNSDINKTHYIFMFADNTFH